MGQEGNALLIKICIFAFCYSKQTQFIKQYESSAFAEIVYHINRAVSSKMEELYTKYICGRFYYTPGLLGVGKWETHIVALFHGLCSRYAL